MLVAHQLLPAEHADWIDGRVLEAFGIRVLAAIASWARRPRGTRRPFVGHGLACGGGDTEQVASGGLKAIRMVYGLWRDARGGCAISELTCSEIYPKMCQLQEFRTRLNNV